MANKYFCYALSAHIILVLCASFILLPPLGSRTNPPSILLAYSAAKSNNEIQKALHKHPQGLAKKSQAMPAHHQVFSARKIIASKGDSPTRNKILALLHAAIANKQTYPDSAIEWQQKGVVTVAFTLTPAGRLFDILLIKSSGFGLLDQAALSAVQAASPVKTANGYLKAPENFTIDVVFE